jgi:hypothetical protein
MRTLISSCCLLVVLTFVAMAQNSASKAGKSKNLTASGGPFTPACTLPFPGTTGLNIDKTCGMLGSETSLTPEGLQNQAKNNFCASGPPITVTPEILLSLQRATEAAKVTFGSHALLPKDRSTLQTGFALGGATYREGQLVQMAAYFIETHPADLSSGESVNCDVKEDPLGNDVHMALGPAYGADECTSVTAELSPHFRPTEWELLGNIEAKNKTTKPAAITQFPIRVTGQLFFDASHKLCTNGQEVSGNPARQSAWEIHPVYQVDVCREKTLTGCAPDNADVWIPIKDWKPPAGN